MVANPPPPHQVQAAQQQVFEEEDAHLAAQEAEEKRKERERFKRTNAKVSKAVGNVGTRVAQALGVTPGRDLTDLASGKKKVLGKDAQNAVKEVKNYSGGNPRQGGRLLGGLGPVCAPSSFIPLKLSKILPYPSEKPT